MGSRLDSPSDEVTRREFLRAGASQAIALTALATTGTTGGALAAQRDRYADLNSERYLGSVQLLARVEDDEVFTEGPAVDRAGNVFFTNIPVNKILVWNPREEALSVFRDDSHETNGLLFDPRGRLLACEGAAARVTRTDMDTGAIEVLVDEYRGRRLAKPNDLCLDGEGRVYFTSRSEVQDPEGENPKGVYRIDPDGTVERLLEPDRIHMPNGIVTSSDGRTLYVVEAHPDANHHRDIRAYDLGPNGTVSNDRVLVDFYPGRSGDGMCIDAEGNLYVAAGLHATRGSSETLDTRPGIHVISPAGTLVAYRETPEDTVTNCTFGGDDLRTLYVTCGTLLLGIRTQISGKPSYRPLA